MYVPQTHHHSYKRITEIWDLGWDLGDTGMKRQWHHVGIFVGQGIITTEITVLRGISKTVPALLT